MGTETTQRDEAASVVPILAGPGFHLCVGGVPIIAERPSKAVAAARDAANDALAGQAK